MGSRVFSSYGQFLLNYQKCRCRAEKDKFGEGEQQALCFWLEKFSVPIGLYNRPIKIGSIFFLLTHKRKKNWFRQNEMLPFSPSIIRNSAVVHRKCVHACCCCWCGFTCFFFEKYLTFFNYIIKAPPPHFNGKIIKELRLEVSDLQKQNDILREEISRVKLEKDKLGREVSYRNTHNDILREQISQLKLEKDKLRANVMQNDSLAKKKYKLEEQLKHKR